MSDEDEHPVPTWTAERIAELDAGAVPSPEEARAYHALLTWRQHQRLGHKRATVMNEGRLLKMERVK